VVKHLNRLAHAGLLEREREREREGRDVRYRVTTEPLSDAVTWIAEVGGEWDTRLAALQPRLSG
jgi:DNA-binding transcriptional ArsR family regulator